MSTQSISAIVHRHPSTPESTAPHKGKASAAPHDQPAHSRLRFFVMFWLFLALSACGGGRKEEPPAVEPGFVAPSSARNEVVDGVPQIVADRQLLIALVEDVTPSQYEAIIKRLQALPVVRLGELRELKVLQVVVAQRSDEATVVDALKIMPGVDRVTLNYAVRTARANPPGQAMSTAEEMPHRLRPLAILPEGRYWTSVIGLDAARAVQSEAGVDTASTVAVIDTGMPATQNVMAETRVTRLDAFGRPLTDDSTSASVTHGKTVAAFAAGASADAGGVSDKSKVLSIDVYTNECTGIFSAFGCPLNLGVQFLSDVFSGVLTALRSDARIINVSWGARVDCSDSRDRRLRSQIAFRESLKPVVNLARSRDRLIVFAAGNSCEKQDDQLLESETDPAADSWTSHALIVGASTSDGRDALFSRMGRVVNLVAPGEGVSWGQVPENGTSFSAPIVAGAAALIQGIAPDLSAPETRSLLIDSANPTLNFADAGAAKLLGYDGGNATTPNRILNLGSASQAARLARAVPLRALDGVSLRRGERREVTFDVEIPPAGVAALDVVFLVDGSGSYGDDLSSMRSQAGGMIDALQARGIDVQFAVATFQDFPLGSFGDRGNRAFRLVTSMTRDRTAVIAGIASLTASGGNDEPESQLEALFQTATGRGRDINGDGRFDPAAGDVPPEPIGWRTGAARVVLLATDAAFHAPERDATYPGPSFEATLAALQKEGIRVIGLQSGTTASATADIQRVVTATGGSLYQLGTDSARIAEAVAAGISSALSEIEITAQCVAGAAWIADVVQSKASAMPGERVTFTITSTGSIPSARQASAHPRSWLTER